MVTYSYVYPSSLLPGEAGYYDVTVYGAVPSDSLAVGVTDWMDPIDPDSAHRFPVSDVTWEEQGTYFKTLKVNATVHNDTETSVSSARILVVLKDQTGLPLKTEKWFTPYIGPNSSSTVTVSIFSEFEGFASVEVLAYTD
jgi:hypothetical protein